MIEHKTIHVIDPDFARRVADLEITPELYDRAMARIVGEAEWGRHKESQATMKRWHDEMENERQELAQIWECTPEEVDQAWAHYPPGNLSWSQFRDAAMADIAKPVHIRGRLKATPAE